MKKTASIFLFLMILVVLPLAGKLQLLLSWPAALVAGFSVILLSCQPSMNLRDSKNHSKTDNNTMLYIVLMSSFGLLSSVVEWAYWHKGLATLNWISLSGIVLSTLGMSIRLWAILTLKSAFSATVQVKKDQQLITTGPYKWLRHPSYTGAWLLLIGMALVLQSTIGFLIMCPGMLWIYSKRIVTEERTLVNAFGQQYLTYMQGTWKMFPAW
jgi:protein-S-isoprenylcysteine O-methyltransferase Ste14